MGNAVESAFEPAGAAALFAVGMAMTLLAVIVEREQTVAVALVGFGSALMALGVLLPRLVGPLKVSAQGLEGELTAAVKAEAAAKGLSGAATQKAVEIASSATDMAVSRWLDALLEDAEREAAGEASAAIDPDRIRDALRDPLVKGLLRDAQNIVARERAVEGA